MKKTLIYISLFAAMACNKTVEEVPRAAIDVYPNPFSDYAGITNLGIAPSADIVIRNGKGKTVFDYQGLSLNESVSADMTKEAEGIYYLEYSDANGEKVSTPIIKLKE